MSGDSEGGDPLAALAQAQNIQAVEPPWMKGVGAQTQPQAMPNQLEAISKQLAAGFGTPKVGQAQFMKHLDQVYDPVRSLNFAPPKPVKKTTTPTVTQAPGKYGNPYFKNNQWHVSKDGVDMVFDPDLYHAGKGYIPLGGAKAGAVPPVWSPIQGAAQQPTPVRTYTGGRNSR